MAKKRMMSDAVYYSDAFLALKPLDKLLYTYLVLSADDDGMLNGVRYQVHVAGARNVNLKNLIEAGFVLECGNGIYAITHWHVMNVIKNRKPTFYTREFNSIFLDENNQYITKKSAENAGSEDFFGLKNEPKNGPLVQYSSVQVNTSKNSTVSPPLPFEEPEGTETVFKEGDFEKVTLYHLVLDFARDEHIQTSEKSIRKFIRYNLDKNKEIFRYPDRWRSNFRKWAELEKDPTAIVGSEHFDHLGG